MNNSEPYFFISYSQRNRIVDEDLAYFDEQSVNYWIDQEGMRSTDNTRLACARKAIGGIRFV